MGPAAAFAPALSAEARAIITEELDILKRLRAHLEAHVRRWRDINYEEALLELRDELGEAQEDEVAQIVHQMANLASLSSHQDQARGAEAPDAWLEALGRTRGATPLRQLVAERPDPRPAATPTPADRLTTPRSAGDADD